MEGQIKVRIAQVLTALTALCICAVAWAQPMPAPTVTEAQACGQWVEPLTLELPSDRRIWIARLVELVAEDVSNTQSRAALFAARNAFPLSRMRTREPRDMHGDSLVAMVASVVPSGDVATRAAIVARIRQILMHAGSGRISIEEKRACCFTRNPDGTRTCQSPTGGFCEGGGLPQLTSRNRFLRPSDATDNFFAGSYVSGGPEVDRTSWRGEPGYSFRIFVKPGSRPLTINLERVYDAEHHPRPAAVLCRELHALIDAPPPSDAASKERIFARMAELTTATIAEGEINAAIWATNVIRDVSARVADLEALRRSEEARADLNQQLQNRWAEIQRVRSSRDQSDARTSRWQKVTASAGLFSFIAIIAAIAVGILSRAAAVKREMRSFLEPFKEEILQWRCFVEDVLGQEHNVTKSIQTTFPVDALQEQMLEPGRFVEFLKLIREGVNSSVKRMKSEFDSINTVFLEAVGQDGVSEIVGFKGVKIEGADALVLNSPLTPPQIRTLLEGTMRVLRNLAVTVSARDNLKVSLEGSEERVRGLTKQVYAALSAASLPDAKTILEEALVDALRGDFPTPVRHIASNRKPPNGALPSG